MRSPAVAIAWEIWRKNRWGFWVVLGSFLCGPLDEVKAQHRRFVLRFETAQLTPPAVPGALSVSGAGKEWSLLCNGARAELPEMAANLSARIVDEQAPSLNEIFVAHAGAPLRATAGEAESTH